jgi:hypothetical protein
MRSSSWSTRTGDAKRLTQNGALGPRSLFPRGVISSKLPGAPALRLQSHIGSLRACRPGGRPRSNDSRVIAMTRCDDTSSDSRGDRADHTANAPALTLVMTLCDKNLGVTSRNLRLRAVPVAPQT